MNEISCLNRENVLEADSFHGEFRSRPPTNAKDRVMGNWNPEEYLEPATLDPIEQIVERVCATRKVLRKELFSRKRTSRIALARQFAMYEMRKLGRSFADIGLYFGRDHTTVIHACRTIDRIIERMKSAGVSSYAHAAVIARINAKESGQRT